MVGARTKGAGARGSAELGGRTIPANCWEFEVTLLALAAFVSLLERGIRVVIGREIA